MRIAHFIQRYPPALGGSESYFQRLSRYLTDRGDEVTVWTTTALDLAAFWSPRGKCLPSGERNEDGLIVKRFPLWRVHGRRWLLKPLSLVPHRLWQALTLPCNPVAFGMWHGAGQSRERYDAVHATAFPYAWPIACGLRLARRLGVPFLLTPFLHTGDPNDSSDRTRRQYTQPALRHLLLEADRVFAQTPTEMATLEQVGVRPERMVLQGLGVDPAECTGGDRAAVRARWGVADSDVVVGHLANLSAEKGTIDLLNAADVAARNGVPCTVLLAGPEMPNFQRFWSRYQPVVKVLRLGVLSENQKRDFFAGIDIFALPSRSDSFGLVLLEAWANGVPCVAYRAGGIADVIHHGRDGLLVQCGDIRELADSLGCMIRDSSLRQQFGDAGRIRTGTDFVWEEKLQIVRDVMRPRLAAARRAEAKK